MGSTIDNPFDREDKWLVNKHKFSLKMALLYSILLIGYGRQNKPAHKRLNCKVLDILWCRLYAL